MLVFQRTELYKRHQPAYTLLYQLLERHYPEFKEMLSEQYKKSRLQPESYQVTLSL